jgi:hypoxanthine-DNA glycosylase
MPSPKSRQYGFYYGNPQNCFWNILARTVRVQKRTPPDISTGGVPHDNESRTAFLLSNKIALWDVLHSCEITGAADNSIKNPVANSFIPLLKNSHIKKIFTTGKTATHLFNKLCSNVTGITAIYLPSTSPANRKMQANPSFAEQWEQIASALSE